MIEITVAHSAPAEATWEHMNAIKIEIFTDNGHCHQFEQQDDSRMDQICQQIESSRIFNQKVLIFASEFSVTNIQGAAIEMVRCNFPIGSVNGLVSGEEELRLITEEDFRKTYASLSQEAKLEARNVEPGARVTSYLEVNLFSGKRLYMRLNAVKKPSSEGRVFFTHLFDRPAMIFRLENDGVGLINPHKVSAIKVYPGPGKDVLPNNALYAHDVADR